MLIYAGIDEAGYGPLLGPLVVGRAVLAVPNLDPLADIDDTPPQLWQRLSKVVARNLRDAKGRLVVNDSKKLKTAASGITHLERSVLAFAFLAGHDVLDVGHWLDVLGERDHHDLSHMPWYAPGDDHPWQTCPTSVTSGEVAVARAMLKATAARIGVEMPDMGAKVVFEDRFNKMVKATRSKAATNFTFVAAHLAHFWQRFGEHSPFVVVDRQSGRTHYRELLSQAFPAAAMAVLDESPKRSAYRLEEGNRRMHVSFLVEAERQHMPVALASMISKYTREILMQRFNHFFRQCAPDVKPTAGYAEDGRRFLNEITPALPSIGLTPAQLARIS